MMDKSKGNKLADENDRNLSVQILLTEYTAAKNEIMYSLPLYSYL